MTVLCMMRYVELIPRKKILKKSFLAEQNKRSALELIRSFISATGCDITDMISKQNSCTSDQNPENPKCDRCVQDRQEQDRSRKRLRQNDKNHPCVRFVCCLECSPVSNTDPDGPTIDLF